MTCGGSRDASSCNCIKFRPLHTRGCPPGPCPPAARCPPHTSAAPRKQAQSRDEHHPALHSAQIVLPPRICSAVVMQVKHSNALLSVLQEVKHTDDIDVVRHTSNTANIALRPCPAHATSIRWTFAPPTATTAARLKLRNTFRRSIARHRRREVHVLTTLEFVVECVSVMKGAVSKSSTIVLSGADKVAGDCPTSGECNDETASPIRHGERHFWGPRRRFGSLRFRSDAPSNLVTR